MICHGLSDAGMALLTPHLPQLNRVHHIGLHGDGITDLRVPPLAQMTQLTGLDLTHSDVTVNCLRHLRPLNQLRDLKLGPFDVDHRLDHGYGELLSPFSLQKLEFSTSEMSSVDIQAIIQAQPNLEALSFFTDGASLDPNTWTELANLAKLEELELAGAQISVILNDVLTLTNLRVLKLPCADVKDRDVLDIVSRLPKLEFLGLEDCDQLQLLGCLPFVQKPQFDTLLSVGRLVEDVVDECTRLAIHTQVQAILQAIVDAG